MPSGIVLAGAISKGDEMRFAEHDWRLCEPTWEQVLAAAYLEAKGFIFGEHFEVKNVVECAENVYRAELSMDGKQ